LVPAGAFSNSQFSSFFQRLSSNVYFPLVVDGGRSAVLPAADRASGDVVQLVRTLPSNTSKSGRNGLRYLISVPERKAKRFWPTNELGLRKPVRHSLVRRFTI